MVVANSIQSVLDYAPTIGDCGTTSVRKLSSIHNLLREWCGQPRRSPFDWNWVFQPSYITADNSLRRSHCYFHLFAIGGYIIKAHVYISIPFHHLPRITFHAFCVQLTVNIVVFSRPVLSKKIGKFGNRLLC